MGNLDEVVAANPGTAAIELDISDPASIEKAAGQVTRDYPGLNVLFNNAGIILADHAPDGSTTSCWSTRSPPT